MHLEGGIIADNIILQDFFGGILLPDRDTRREGGHGRVDVNNALLDLAFASGLVLVGADQLVRRRDLPHPLAEVDLPLARRHSHRC